VISINQGNEIKHILILLESILLMVIREMERRLEEEDYQQSPVGSGLILPSTMMKVQCDD